MKISSLRPAIHQLVPVMGHAQSLKEKCVVPVILGMLVPIALLNANWIA